MMMMRMRLGEERPFVFLAGHRFWRDPERVTRL